MCSVWQVEGNVSHIFLFPEMQFRNAVRSITATLKMTLHNHNLALAVASLTPLIFTH